MAANAITYEELGAYCGEMLRPMSVWEKRLLRRVDDAVLAVWRGQGPKPKAGPGAQPDTAIPASNPKGIRALFRDIAALKTKGAQPPAAPK